MAARILFRNVRVITTTGIASGEVLVEEGRIAGVERPGVLPADIRDIIDGGGDYLSPGFVDVHTHAAGNRLHGRHLEAVYTATRAHLRHGTTTIIPTTTASTTESLLTCIDLFNKMEPTRGAARKSWDYTWKRRTSSTPSAARKTRRTSVIPTRRSTTKCSAAPTASFAGRSPLNCRARGSS